MAASTSNNDAMVDINTDQSAQLALYALVLRPSEDNPEGSIVLSDKVYYTL